MTIYRKNQMAAGGQPDGIWVDYRNGCWLFMIKDRVWQPEEIHQAEHGQVIIHFIQKGIADAFLLEIDDCLEPSDLPFSMVDADESLKHSLNQSEDYCWEIVLMDESGRVCAVRDGRFSHANSVQLKKKLKERCGGEWNEADVDHAIEKIEQRYEPYELEQFAVFSEKG